MRKDGLREESFGYTALVYAQKTLHIQRSQTETEKEIEKALYFLISKDKVEDDEDKESLNFLYRATFLK